jgi:hypothetical protein
VQNCRRIFYYYYEKADEETKSNMILFTANHKFNITDSSEQFRNKHLFCSPAITTAVDFNISDKQDALYISKETISSPQQVFNKRQELAILMSFITTVQT